MDSLTSVSLGETLAGKKTFRDTAGPVGGCDSDWKELKQPRIVPLFATGRTLIGTSSP
ncbi:hypothetical protein [Malikia granosa]|uniref:hypothetical protein n=1 Tax=Malikia granosa TaxID=263067 RepID=UPI0014730D22|nr:hypothetical protein [Malikia granosa]